MRLNLDPVRRTVESLMTDRVVIWFDAERTDDDTFDRTTGTYSQPVPDELLVYEGPAYIVAMGEGTVRENEEGGQYVEHTWYDISLPLSAPDIPNLSRVGVTATTRDPQLLDQTFQVTEVFYSTFAVKRKVRAERVHRVR